MEDLIDTLTRGNIIEVKVTLASVLLALAVYQVLLITVAYGKVRPPFLQAGPAGRAHRVSGDAIVVVAVCVSIMCVGVYGFEEDGAHIASALGLLAALTVKIGVLRFGGHTAGKALPYLGTIVLICFALTFSTAAWDVLADA